MGYNKNKWSTGEVVTADKMNYLFTGETSFSSHVFEIKDDDGNIVFAVTDNGEIITKGFNSGSTSNSIAFPHYNVIGSPKPYVTSLDDVGNISVFSDVDALYAAYDELVTAYPLLFQKNNDLGYDASGTYAIRHYTLGMLNPTITTDRVGEGTNLWSDTAYPRKRILINGNIHGWSERYCCYGCYLLIKEILESAEDWAMFIKNNIILEIVPEPNPWGYANKSANNSKGYNLNRTYFDNIQAENQILIDLIEDLIPKGLVGTIDFHNTTNGTGYFVAKPTYTRWDYYAVLTAQLESITHDSFKELNGSDKTNFFHLWDATGNEGQLHQYADYKGLLGCTFEVGGTYAEDGALLSKMLGANIISAFATYEGN